MYAVTETETKEYAGGATASDPAPQQDYSANNVEEVAEPAAREVLELPVVDTPPAAPAAPAKTVKKAKK